jgi:hypothetical protein
VRIVSPDQLGSAIFAHCDDWLDRTDAGHILNITVDRLSPDQFTVRRAAIVAAGSRKIGHEIPRNAYGIARAVAWLMPYPAESLLGEYDPDGIYLLETLNCLTDSLLRWRTGVFQLRGHGQAKSLSDCWLVNVWAKAETPVTVDDLWDRKVAKSMVRWTPGERGIVWDFDEDPRDAAEWAEILEDFEDGLIEPEPARLEPPKLTDSYLVRFKGKIDLSDPQQRASPEYWAERTQRIVEMIQADPSLISKDLWRPDGKGLNVSIRHFDDIDLPDLDEPEWEPDEWDADDEILVPQPVWIDG